MKPLFLYQSSLLVAWQDFSYLDETAYAKAQAKRCPLNKPLLTKLIFCYPRTECWSDTNCLPASKPEPAICRKYCPSGYRAKGIVLLPAGHCQQKPDLYCKQHPAFTDKKHCTSPTPGVINVWSSEFKLDCVLRDFKAGFFLAQLAKYLRIKPARVTLGRLRAGSTIAEARVSEDMEQDRPALEMFKRLKKQVDSGMQPLPLGYSILSMTAPRSNVTHEIKWPHVPIPHPMAWPFVSALYLVAIACMVKYLEGSITYDLFTDFDHPDDPGGGTVYEDGDEAEKDPIANAPPPKGNAGPNF
jgi:hypothetical protein